MDNEGLTKSNTQPGKQSHDEGKEFEQRVAEIFRLLHYDVDANRLFGGRQVDLFLSGRFGDIVLNRAIECKSGPVSMDHLDSFLAKLRLVRMDYDDVLGTIVCGVSFTAAVKSHAQREGIQLTLFRDLAAQIFDGHSYAASLIREAESHDRYPLSLYIESDIGYDLNGPSLPAAEVIKEWLISGEWNQLTLLGDVGTGKSFLCRRLAHTLAKEFLKQPLENSLPVLVDLRNADRQFSIEGLILTHLAQNGLHRVSFAAFQYSLSQGNIVLLLDGFDEMAARVTPQVTIRNFHELTRCVKGRAKVLLTCRTHYFKARTEAEEVVLGGGDGYGSETARDLYWELISRKGYRIAYVRPFEMHQITEYVSRARPESAQVALDRIKNTYNLLELSQRPMLLDMIVKSIDRLTKSEINPATLYAVYTDAWVHRDQWRDVLSPDAKLQFVTALAHGLWREDKLSIHYSALIEYVQHRLAAQIQNPQELVEVDSEVRTASFLTRDQGGHYGFAHKSYAEYFIARHLAGALSKGEDECLRTRRLTPEIIGFLRYMCEPQNSEALLSSILTGEYVPLVSENALLCLYGLRRQTAVEELDATSTGGQHLVVQLPRSMNLAGAQLDQVVLEGAVMVDVNLRGTSLNQAILSRCDLTGSVAIGSYFEKADLRNASLRSSTFSHVSLKGANCEATDLSAAHFESVDLSDAFLQGCTHDGAQFEAIIALRSILPDRLRAIIYPEKILFNRFLHGSPQRPEYFYANEAALQFLYERIRLHSRYWSLASDIDADDVAQETILQMFRHAEYSQVDSPELIRIGLTIARRIAADYYRRDRIVSFEVPQSLERFPSAAPNPLEQIEVRELEEQRRALLDELRVLLSPQLWRIVEARFVNGKSVRDIAHDEGVSERTIQRFIMKAREIAKGLVHNHS